MSYYIFTELDRIKINNFEWFKKKWTEGNDIYLLNSIENVYWLTIDLLVGWA